DYFCIVGDNGAGKTTLMKALLGLHKISGGAMEFGDGLAPREFGYLTQQSEIQRDFPASVWEIVQSGCQNDLGWRPFYSKSQKQRCRDAMERMGISHLTKRCYRQLSGGQQQRVLLARALCATQKILFLDEPVTGLDPEATAEFYAIIKELHEKDGVTIVMISHDLDACLRYGSRILHLGTDTFCGSKDDYIQWKGGASHG
ncbi:MAG: ATP-binding cassette domain-containing protein, partial [Eubacteriales bacterium]